MSIVSTRLLIDMSIVQILYNVHIVQKYIS